MERKIKDPTSTALDKSGYCINCSYMENGCNVFDANIRNDNVESKEKDEIGKGAPTSHVLESVKSKAPQAGEERKLQPKTDLKQNNAAATLPVMQTPCHPKKSFLLCF